jgi:hypothetical protein
MLRADIEAVSADSSLYERHGIGYGLMRYRNSKTGDIIYDPTLLTAIQRAISVVYTDSLSLESGMIYNPVPTLVIGGFEYIDDKSLPEWDLFKTKEVSSFDAVGTIYDIVKDNRKYETYDTESLDSIYALYKIYGIEYCNPVNSIEIKALYEMEVDYFIAGKITRIPDGARIEISLYKIEKNLLRKLKSEKCMILNDNIDETRKVVKNLTNSLVNISDKSKIKPKKNSKIE